MRPRLSQLVGEGHDDEDHYRERCQDDLSHFLEGMSAWDVRGFFMDMMVAMVTRVGGVANVERHGIDAKVVHQRVDLVLVSVLLKFFF